jgi:hypothetical protein
MFKQENMQRRLRAGFGAPTLLAILMIGAVQHSFAANEAEFNSAEQAVEALYKAVETDDQASIGRIIGPLASSDDMVQDKADRQRFIQKYSEMHRLVKEADGTTVLYIGAENRPFPVPLVSNEGKWGFDVDAGSQEVVFRRIGEDETTAIETCRAIAQKTVNPPSDSFHGYQFRVLQTSNGAAVVAYPSEYGSTGVMTIAVTPDKTVYEKDLGPKTTQLAQAMTRYKADRTWHVSEQ